MHILSTEAIKTALRAHNEVKYFSFIISCLRGKTCCSGSLPRTVRTILHLGVFQRNVFLKDRCTYSVLKLCQPTAEFTAATSIAL